MPRDEGGQPTAAEAAAGYTGGVDPANYAAIQSFYDSGTAFGGGGLDQFGLNPDEEQWLKDQFGVGGQVGLLLAQLGGFNEKLREQAQMAAVQASYAKIASDQAIAAGNLAEAKRYHDQQDQLARYQAQITAEMEYTKSLMAMGDRPDQLFKYAFARYGMQAPQGGAPAQLPIPDFMKQNGMVLNPSQSNQGGAPVQTGVSQNPSLAALIPGANPNPQGVVQPQPPQPALAPQALTPQFAAGLQPPGPGAGLLPGNPTSREVGPFATQPILPHVDIPNKPLGPNTSGPDVIALQRALERLGYFQLPPGANYGFYGNQTTAAVAKFQQDFGLRSSTPGLWDSASASALKANVNAIGNQPAGPSPFSVRGSDAYQSPLSLPQQTPNPGLLSQLPGSVPSMAAGSQPLPGQSGAPTSAQSNAAAQPGPQSFAGATQTLTPALQNLAAQEGNAQSQIPIIPPSGYRYPDLGTISGQSYNRLTPSEQGQYQSYEHDVAGKPLTDVTGDINRLAPQGNLDQPTTFMAQGGLIQEPVVGKGLATGRNYEFGEQGPEQVIPGAGGMGGPNPGLLPPGGPGMNPLMPGGMAQPNPKKRKPLAPQQLKKLSLEFHPSLMPR